MILQVLIRALFFYLIFVLVKKLINSLRGSNKVSTKNGHYIKKDQPVDAEYRVVDKTSHQQE